MKCEQNALQKLAPLVYRGRPPRANRTYAIVHVTIHDGLTAIARRYCLYVLEMRPASGASTSVRYERRLHREVLACHRSGGSFMRRSNSGQRGSEWRGSSLGSTFT